MELFRAWLFYMPNIFGYHQRPAAFPKKKFEIYYFWREQLEKSCEIRVERKGKEQKRCLTFGERPRPPRSQDRTDGPEECARSAGLKNIYFKALSSRNSIYLWFQHLRHHPRRLATNDHITTSDDDDDGKIGRRSRCRNTIQNFRYAVYFIWEVSCDHLL